MDSMTELRNAAESIRRALHDRPVEQSDIWCPRHVLQQVVAAVDSMTDMPSGMSAAAALGWWFQTGVERAASELVDAARQGSHDDKQKSIAVAMAWVRVAQSALAIEKDPSIVEGPRPTLRTIIEET